jgi:3-oxoacyl-[acyl-carrier protein] reductase
MPTRLPPVGIADACHEASGPRNLADRPEDRGAAGRVTAAGDKAMERAMGKLDGKVALVTGSGRNIGRATVLKLAGEGAHVVVNARSNQAEADAVVREAQTLGVKAIAVVADVASKQQVEAMAARALSEFGRVDILINNAAIRPHKPFTEVTAADWEAVRVVVLDGAVYLTRALIDTMVKI